MRAAQLVQNRLLELISSPQLSHLIEPATKLPSFVTLFAPNRLFWLLPLCCLAGFIPSGYSLYAYYTAHRKYVKQGVRRKLRLLDPGVDVLLSFEWAGMLVDDDAVSTDDNIHRSCFGW